MPSPKELAFQCLPMMPVLERAESLLRWQQLRSAREFEDAEVKSLGVIAEARIITVIATFKRPVLVEKAVASALAQNVDGHEVVVVDDGGGQVPSFSDPRVHALALSRNSGICGLVRNIGIRTSTSSYVAFLDDDNTWEPGHLSSCLAQLSAGAAMAYCGVKVVDPSGAVLLERSEPYDRRALTHRNHIDASALVLRRSDQVLFSRLRRHTGGARQEDWELAYRLGRRGRVAHLPESRVNYLANPESHFSRY